jgi:phage terminase large subunit-like protein
MFDQSRADRVKDFVSCLCHTKGEWAGKPFELQQWQIDDIINPIFGNVDEYCNRIVRTAYIEIPRKNGKTETIAAIGLYLMAADNEPRAEIYSAAADREQAAIIFEAAAFMVENNEELNAVCKVVRSKKRIIYRPTGSFFQALSSDAFSKHGQNAHAVLYDELHAARDRELWDVLATSMGSRRQPLMIAITTAGFDRSTICYEQHDYAERVINGSIVDPTFYGLIYAVTEEDDWKDPAVWYKANPNLGISIKYEFLVAQCERAKNVPAYQNTFKRLYLNIWTQQSVRWLDMDVWMKSAGDDYTIEDLVDQHCFVGLDLSSSLDLTAAVAAFPDKKTGIIRCLSHFWIPEGNLRQKIDRDKVPYDAWVRDGYITATPGLTIRKEYILNWLRNLAEMCLVENVAYDPWCATELVKDMMDEGFVMVEFRQGMASMSPASKEFMKRIVDATLYHGNNPVLNWMAGNIAVKEDPSGNIKPDKATSTSRIDGIISMIMANDGALRDLANTSVYEDRELKSLG